MGKSIKSCQLRFFFASCCSVSSSLVHGRIPLEWGSKFFYGQLTQKAGGRLEQYLYALWLALGKMILVSMNHFEEKGHKQFLRILVSPCIFPSLDISIQFPFISFFNICNIKVAMLVHLFLESLLYSNGLLLYPYISIWNNSALTNIDIL